MKRKLSIQPRPLPNHDQLIRLAPHEPDTLSEGTLLYRYYPVYGQDNYEYVPYTFIQNVTVGYDNVMIVLPTNSPIPLHVYNAERGQYFREM